jgi:hypothetical protein
VLAWISIPGACRCMIDRMDLVTEDLADNGAFPWWRWIPYSLVV